MSSFRALYRRDPPPLLRGEGGATLDIDKKFAMCGGLTLVGETVRKFKYGWEPTLDRDE